MKRSEHFRGNKNVLKNNYKQGKNLPALRNLFLLENLEGIDLQADTFPLHAILPV